MPISRLVRPAVLAALAMLGGCVAAPQPIPPGSVVLSQQCSSGFYQCVLPQPNQVGTPCSCPGLGAPSYGVVR